MTLEADAATTAPSAPPDRISAPTGSRESLIAGIAVGLALVAAIVLYFVVRSDLWLDEALTVNIARLPLGDMPSALKRDGAPPAYYVLLHFWMDVFGEGDTAVRGLSSAIAIATFPAFYFAGRRLGGRTAGWIAVLVFATSPYTFRYASETRMYTLVMFLVVWGYLAVVRALERPSVGRLAVVALAVATLLYTHNWSYYLLVVVGVVLLLRGWRGATAHDRRGAWRVLVAMAVGGLCYLPWLPVLRYQLAHTGTPWGDARLPWSAFVALVGDVAGLGRPLHGELYFYAGLLIALVLLGLLGAAVDARHIDLDLATRPVVRWEVVVGFGALAVGLALSYVAGTAFEGRYGAVGVPLLLLAAAMGAMVFAGPRVRAGVLAVFVLLGLAGGLRNATDERTQAGEVAAIIGAEARPGDVVLYCPDQLGPSVHRILGGGRGLDEVTFPALGGPARVNWVDYRDRIRATDTQAVADQVLARADGARIWYVISPGYRSVEGRCEELGAALAVQRPGSTARTTPDDETYFEFMGLTEFPAG